jgi:hypothetical protein
MLNFVRNVTFLAAAIATAFVGVEPEPLAASGAQELAATQGGAGCVDCSYSPLGCVANSCQAAGGAWLKITGSMANPTACFDPSPLGKPGGTVCSTANPQTCLSIQACTQAGCTNCAAASTTKVDTTCTVGGTYCPPPAD